MVRVALNFNRTPLIRLCQHARREAADRQRSGEIEGFAGQMFRRGFGLRDNRSLRAITACGKPCQRHRGAHQLEKLASAHEVAERLRMARKLARQLLLKIGRLHQLVQTAPELLACTLFMRSLFHADSLTDGRWSSRSAALCGCCSASPAVAPARSGCGVSRWDRRGCYTCLTSPSFLQGCAGSDNAY